MFKSHFLDFRLFGSIECNNLKQQQNEQTKLFRLKTFFLNRKKNLKNQILFFLNLILLKPYLCQPSEFQISERI